MQPGDVIAGRYEIESRAGAGGMGTIYRARDHARRERVAVKLLRHAEASDLGRFEREARLLAALSHPGIVRFVDHGVDDGAPFLVMEWLEGETLRGRLDRLGVTPAEAVALVRRVADALGEAHRHGIVHRDVKPENLIFVGDALDGVKLIDFGLARRDATREITRTGAMVGTPAYMAPEQARGERVDARADVFALGCVLYECLTGAPAFEGVTQHSVWAKVLFCDPPALASRCPDATPALIAIAARMMARAASERLPDGAAVAAALAEPGIAGAGERRRSRHDAIATPATQRIAGPAPFTCVLLVDGGEPAVAPGALPDVGLALEPLAGGALVGIPAHGTPAEQVEAAARAAMALAAALPGRAIAIAAAVGSLEHAIDRTARLVADLAIARAALASNAQIVVDDVAAGLLDGRLAIRRVDGRNLLG